MKKTIMSVTATAVIASTFAGAIDVEAASYKVKSGDSLWSIAQKYNTSVSSLKSINKLNNTIIFPNQIIKTDKGSSSNSDDSSSNNSSSSSKSSTYKVQSGDTLSGIAAKHNISLSNLMDWNSLNTTLIYPGDVFKVSKSSGSGSSSNSSNSDGSSSNSSNSDSSGSSESTYKVKSGDTLSEIGADFGVSVGNIKKWNGLSSSLIFVGQTLKMNGATGSNSDDNSSSVEDTPSNVDYNVSKLINEAKSHKGAPYAWGGQSPSGFDCSGFIHYVYNKAGKSMSRTSSGGYYNRSFYVNKPKLGDLVFFEGTYKAGISHLGIYIGGNEFIHAGSDGVEISNLNNSYWSKHFDGYKRFY